MDWIINWFQSSEPLSIPYYCRILLRFIFLSKAHNFTQTSWLDYFSLLTLYKLWLRGNYGYDNEDSEQEKMAQKNKIIEKFMRQEKVLKYFKILISSQCFLLQVSLEFSSKNNIKICSLSSSLNIFYGSKTDWLQRLLAFYRGEMRSELLKFLIYYSFLHFASLI